jgi:hypothetical protein
MYGVRPQLCERRAGGDGHPGFMLYLLGELGAPLNRSIKDATMRRVAWRRPPLYPVGAPGVKGRLPAP